MIDGDGEIAQTNEEQLKKIRECVTSWNEWRHQNPNVKVCLVNADLQGVDLSVVDLHDAQLMRSNLQDANLSQANLQGALLMGADLQSANLPMTKLQDAVLNNANLQGANMPNVKLQGAELYESNLQNVNLFQAKLQGAKLRSTDLRNAKIVGANFERADLDNANLLNADLREVVNLRLDNTLTKNAHFSSRANDAWSILRNTYTGYKFIFLLLGLVAFALPYIGKIGFWSLVNRGQWHTQNLLVDIRKKALELGIDDQVIAELGLSQEEISAFSQCLRGVCEQRSVWQLLLGVDQNGLFWLLPITLITYNVLRGWLTYSVGPMVDEEERSGYSPAWKGNRWWQGYRLLYKLHKFTSVLFYIAIAAFLINAYHWLSQPIYLPA